MLQPPKIHVALLPLLDWPNFWGGFWWRLPSTIHHHCQLARLKELSCLTGFRQEHAGDPHISTAHHSLLTVKVLSSYDVGCEQKTPRDCIYCMLYGGFLKWWYPTTMGFPTKNDHFVVFWGYHHLRKHPYVLYLSYVLSTRTWIWCENSSQIDLRSSQLHLCGPNLCAILQADALSSAPSHLDLSHMGLEIMPLPTNLPWNSPGKGPGNHPLSLRASLLTILHSS